MSGLPGRGFHLIAETTPPLSRYATGGGNLGTTSNQIMADFDLGEGLRRVFLAGVGALATGVELGQQSFEKSQQIVDGLVKKGELTVEQGKALNTELKHKAQEAKEKAEEKTEGAKEQSDAGAAAEDPSPAEGSAA